MSRDTVVTVDAPAAFGRSRVSIADAGSDASELVEMFRQALVGCGFPQEVADCVRFDAQVVTDQQYGGTSS